MSVNTATELASSTVATLQSTLSGSIPALFPTIIAVAILFAGYGILKRLYHSRF